MIQDIRLRHFMAHTELAYRGLPGINLIIGKNDTGKTGLLRMMYAVAKSLEDYSLKQEQAAEPFKKVLAAKLDTVFMPRKGLGDLVQKGKSEPLHVEAKIYAPEGKYSQAIQFSYGSDTQDTIKNGSEDIHPWPSEQLNALFIPAKEVLTALRDIRTIRNKEYGRGFDDTYLDLITALDIDTRRGNIQRDLTDVNRRLEELFQGTIEQTHNDKEPFIFKKGKQQFAMHQTAEGIKKIGILTTLIRNRQLRKGTMLFMDEPETALHPEAIRAMVEMIVAMSRAGVQVFLATHSFFVIKQLAICTKREEIEALCWNLERAESGDVRHSFEQITNGALPKNAIVDEALAMYNDDVKAELGL